MEKEMPDRVVRFVLVAALALAPLGASAQTAPSEAAAPNATETTVRTENGRRVYVASTTIEVRGEIQRPYAFSVSGRSSLGYTYFDQPIQFLQLILDAVRRAPF
ncbi:MAG: hypothetical protein U0326_12550 [Polyangiales bacterium]